MSDSGLDLNVGGLSRAARGLFVVQPPRLEREDYNKLFVVFLVDV